MDENTMLFKYYTQVKSFHPVCKLGINGTPHFTDLKAKTQ